MKRETSTKFCGVLISLHEVMKLQNFEFDVSDAIPADVLDISPFFNCLFVCLFLYYMQEKMPYDVLII